MNTKAQITITAIIQLLRECVKVAGEIPAGHLYARLLEHTPNMSADTFNSLIDILIKSKQVSRDRFHILRYIGK